MLIPLILLLSVLYLLHNLRLTFASRPPPSPVSASPTTTNTTRQATPRAPSPRPHNHAREKMPLAVPSPRPPGSFSPHPRPPQTHKSASPPSYTPPPRFTPSPSPSASPIPTGFPFPPSQVLDELAGLRDEVGRLRGENAALRTELDRVLLQRGEGPVRPRPVYPPHYAPLPLPHQPQAPHALAQAPPVPPSWRPSISPAPAPAAHAPTSQERSRRREEMFGAVLKRRLSSSARSPSEPDSEDSSGEHTIPSVVLSDPDSGSVSLLMSSPFPSGTLENLPSPLPSPPPFPHPISAPFDTSSPFPLPLGSSSTLPNLLLRRPSPNLNRLPSLGTLPTLPTREDLSALEEFLRTSTPVRGKGVVDDRDREEEGEGEGEGGKVGEGREGRRRSVTLCTSEPREEVAVENGGFGFEDGEV